jgi:hypothetical protein
MGAPPPYTKSSADKLFNTIMLFKTITSSNNWFSSAYRAHLFSSGVVMNTMCSVDSSSIKCAEDTKGVIRSCTLKNHRQSTKDHVQQDKQWYAKHYTYQATRTKPYLNSCILHICIQYAKYIIIVFYSRK